MQSEYAVDSEKFRRKCNVLNIGLTDYAYALNLQRRLLVLRQNSSIYDTLVVTEHTPVITFGRGYRDELPELSVPVFSIERGGEGTYHGPGQLVAYPIINLTENGIGVRRLVQGMLRSGVAALSATGIDAEARLDPVGIWIGDRKIASLGIAVKRWVSFHGLAINLNNDLDGFALINPCGMSASTITSAKKVLGHSVDFTSVQQALIDAFMKEFDLQPSPGSLSDLPAE